MTTMDLLIYILVMALVTYLIRMLPVALFRKKIKSRFVRSFLYYVPYAVLAAMTIPWVFYATADVWKAAAGFVAAVVMALWGKSLLTVAMIACSAALFVGLFL